MIFVTGSSGYVGSALVPFIRALDETIGVDLRPSDFTDWVMDIASSDFRKELDKFADSEILIVNLAAGKFDFGVEAEVYFRLNVLVHEQFLKSLESFRIKKFVHVSSVASIDGRKISYSSDLDCDDAYRSTKFLQEKLIQDWCVKRNIELVMLFPSAIFSTQARSDTNIGKMQKLSRFLPFIPNIPVDKTLTFLPNFSKFIIEALKGNLSSGNYLTVEEPVLSVTEMIKVLSGGNKRVINIPFFRSVLSVIADFLYMLGGFGKVDLKLTPNRVVKLFSSTLYDVSDLGIDSSTYGAYSSSDLRYVLQAFEDIETGGKSSGDE
jgi:nucleoside-diphosphate-sugar epimerase